MRTNGLLLLVLVPGWAAQAADVCNPADLLGPYAFQLTGLTDIAGTPKPTVSLGRIAFDGRGGLSGTASATFSGLLLGNPVTGSYEAKSDCSVIWKLQDDSGGFQNFSGTLSRDGTSVQFKQTDPGGAQRGIMQKTSDACSAADLQKKYYFTVSGSTTPMTTGRRLAHGFRQGDARHSRERQFSRRERLLGAVRIEAPGSRRAGRRTVDNDHAWISGPWRQGNPGLPDRSRCNGGRALHV